MKGLNLLFYCLDDELICLSVYQYFGVDILIYYETFNLTTRLAIIDDVYF